jgi:hypothetical protein
MADFTSVAADIARIDGEFYCLRAVGQETEFPCGKTYCVCLEISIPPSVFQPARSFVLEALTYLGGSRHEEASFM